MKFCTSCGKENTDPNNLFCNYCGTKIETDAPQLPSAKPRVKRTERIEKSQPSPTVEQPPKKKRTGLVVLLVVFAIVFVGVGSIGVFAMLSGMDVLDVGRAVIANRFSTNKAVEVEVVSAKETTMMTNTQQSDEESFPVETTTAEEEATSSAEAAKTVETTMSSAQTTTVAEEAAMPTIQAITSQNENGSSETTILSTTVAPVVPPVDDMTWKESGISVTASSTLPNQTSQGSTFTYIPANVLDGDNDTAWIEGIPGNGEGEWVELSTVDRESATLTVLNILPGYTKSDEVYFNNSRPKDILVDFSDGSQIDFQLKDEKGQWQNIPLGGAISTSFIKITIISVYAGTKFTDTAIAEIVVV